MPRRGLIPATSGRSSPNVSFADVPLVDSTYEDNLALLRRHWKWANFSQFFYTFAQLLAAPDITLVDIEDDLARGTALYLPRIMHRLLYTLTQDRKISLDTWQSSLRKQYLRRDPDANPLGPEPSTPSRVQSRDPTTPPEDGDVGDDPLAPDRGLESAGPSRIVDGPVDLARNADTSVEQSSGEVIEPNVTYSPGPAVATGEVSQNNVAESNPEEVESRNWLELSTLEKLDSLHLLTEWQFQNPHRFRSLMKDDGDHGLWRIDPIGYDAKQNAYWLIGPDRLWIQRKPPKPPAPPKRKRKGPSVKTAAKAPTSKSVVQEKSDSEPEVQPQKRARASNGRALRNKRSSPPATPSGRGARAAKLQANKKLDAQAKELAEFQRQAALSPAADKPGPRSARLTRSSINVSEAPSRRAAVIGTRASARLRGASQDDDDEEWQQIPEEWLNEDIDDSLPSTRTRSSPRKGGSRGKRPPQAPSEDAEGESDDLAHDGLHTGLSSDDAISDLTELSDDEQTEPVNISGEKPEAPGYTPSGETTTEPVILKPEPKGAVQVEDIFASEFHGELPNDFVEWEAICITLQEWESIPERFSKATHYLEKALYKVLALHIVPAVTEDLREAERKRKIEEAIVHRKRSSRIAMKETEKEEARAAAQKKAEESERQARARRQEARAKREEAEREKRESAREQRRLEREERERRAQERKDGASAQRPTPSASVVSSVQPTRNPTPSGIRTPDWTLDCEICGRCGVNMDDGLPMVSCGMCSRWQHIPCHDKADHSSGLPRRNWEVQQFYCSRCKPTAMQRIASGGGSSTTTPDTQRSHSRAGKPYPSQVAAINSYPNTSPDLRYTQQQTPYTNGASYGHQYPQEQMGMTSGAMYARTQRPQGGITFSHYQPQQHGFSRAAWPNGYPTDSYNGRAVSQYNQPYHQNGSYNSGQQAYQYPSSSIPIPSAYNRTQPQDMPQRVMDGTQPMHNQHWVGSSAGRQASSPLGQVAPSHYSAAESLAYMQGSNSASSGWNNSAFSQHSGVTSPTNGQSSPSVPRHSPMGNGGYHFPPS